MKLAATLLFTISLSPTLALAQHPTPIRHIIVIVQENRTPDNLFQDATLINNGADIGKAKDAQPYTIGTCWDIGHGNSSFVADLGLQPTGSFCPSSSYVPGACSKPTCANDTFVQD